MVGCRDVVGRMIGRKNGYLVNWLSIILHRYKPAWVVKYFGDDGRVHVSDGVCIPDFIGGNGWLKEEEQVVGGLVEQVLREYFALWDEFRLALSRRDVDKARSLLRSIGEFLEGHGVNPWPIIDEVNARLRRGGNVLEYLDRLGRLYANVVWGIIVGELSSRFMTLDGGDYIVLLLGRSGGGRYVLPSSEYGIIKLLSGLFPDDVRLLEGVVDNDTAFAVALKRLAGTPYVKPLIEVYLNLNREVVGKLPNIITSITNLACLPSIVRTLRLGYLSEVIPVNDTAVIIEYPSIPYNVLQPTSLTEYFNEC